MTIRAIWTTAAQESGAPAGVKAFRAELPEGFDPGDGFELREDDDTPIWQPPVVPQRVASVRPVAMRRAMRATAWSGGTLLGFVLLTLKSPQYVDALDAFEYMVRGYRADMVQLGAAMNIKPDVIDALLTLAATYPGADAEHEALP